MQKPDGIFKSEFVVKIMTAFLGSIKGSRNLEEGFPQGALGMTAIAVSDHAHVTYDYPNLVVPARTCIHILSLWDQDEPWPVLTGELRNWRG